MAELLFISPQEMANTSILSGNIDIDKYTFCIANVQITTIEPLLGTLLYNKIIADIEGAGLTGLYEVLYNDFVKPITKNEAIAQYLKIASYIVDNGGIYKHAAEGKEVVSKDECQTLAQTNAALAQMYVQRFNKWITINEIPEYQTYQDEVDAKRNITLTAGWHL